MRFAKGHGTENDFVLLPDLDASLAGVLTPRLVSAICDRRAGVGADGVLRVVRSVDEPDAAAMAGDAEWFMDYRNADGSVAEMCGNGIRVFARWLVAEGLVPPGDLVVATRGGVRRVRLEGGGDVRVDMGPYAMPAHLGSVRVTLREGRAAGRAWPAVGVLLPNPHAVAFVEDLGQAGPLLDPPEVSPAEAFSEGVNVELVVDRGPRHVAMRVYERGVGETRSCGTGAAAVMVAAARRAGVSGPSSWTVDVAGGRLQVEERSDGHLEMTGPAVLVAAGELHEDWVEAHR